MKNTIKILIVALAMSQANAQNINDALRYGSEDLYGTARLVSLGGAFTSLGGDVSAMSYNPASSAVFMGSAFTLSTAVPSVLNNASYFNGETSARDTDVNINHAGGVFVFNNDVNPASKWKKFTLGISFNNTNNHDENLFVAGNGNQSIASFFLNQAQGIPLNLLELQGNETIDDLYTFLGQNEGVAAQNAFLAFQGFVIDPLQNDPSNTAYTTSIGGNRFNQDFRSSSRGSNAKYTINFGTQYADFLYLGVNLNSHTTNFINQNSIVETNNTSNVNRVFFENNLATFGSGFSAQLGAILKFNDFRIGISYDTPTWMDISEETSQALQTRRTVNNVTTNITLNPNVINIFETYRLRTPAKIALGTSYVFGQQGFLSFDYSYKDFSSMNFSFFDGDFAFAALNNAIETQLQGAASYRLGGEYIFKNYSFRGGYRYEESPYANDQIASDLSGFSAGVGYRVKNFIFDLGYSYAQQEQAVSLFDTGLTNPAAVNTSFSNFIFTFQIQL